MFCSKCGLEAPDGALFCPKCGLELAGGKKRGPRPNRKGVVIGAVAAALVIVAAVAIAVYVVFFRPYDIDERTFPDAPLRTAVARVGDADCDGKLSREEAASIEFLDVSNTSSTSFEGMQLLPNLSSLNASGCANLTETDYSKVPSLEELDVSNSAVERVDASCMKRLRKLSASGTHLSSLDVSANANLAELDVDDSVEVSGIDATQLKEQWLLTSYSSSGFRGVSENAGIGGPGITDQEYTFEYDASNKPVHAVLHTETSADTSSDRYLTYSRDQDGTLVSFEERYSGNSSVNSYDYAYDAEGRVSSSVLYSTISSYDGRRIDYEYDENGCLAATSGVTKDGSQMVGFLYDYNSAQKLTRIRQTVGEEQRLSIVYGDNGHVDDFANAFGTFQFEYDQEGRCIVKHVYGGLAQMAQGKASYDYDGQGHLVFATRTTKSDAYSFEMSVTCQFDDHGNEVHRDLTMNAESGGSNTGTVDFAYTRVFVGKDAPETRSPIVSGDPTCQVLVQGPIEMNLFAGESDIVKTSLCQTDTIFNDYCI